MDKVTFSEIDGKDHAIIENPDGSFTSMLKSTYDEQQAAIKINEPAAKS